MDGLIVKRRRKRKPRTGTRKPLPVPDEPLKPVPPSSEGVLIVLKTVSIQIGLFVAAACLVFAAAMFLSIALSVIGAVLSAVLKPIGWAGLVELVVWAGEQLFGAGIGFFAFGSAAELGSIGAKLGVFAGVGAYYYCLFQVL